VRTFVYSGRSVVVVVRVNLSQPRSDREDETEDHPLSTGTSIGEVAHRYIVSHVRDSVRRPAALSPSPFSCLVVARAMCRASDFRVFRATGDKRPRQQGRS